MNFTFLNMTPIKAFFQFLFQKWKNFNHPAIAGFPMEDYDEDEITEFDLQPYLGWMEEEFYRKLV